MSQAADNPSRSQRAGPGGDRLEDKSGRALVRSPGEMGFSPSRRHRVPEE